MLGKKKQQKKMEALLVSITTIMNETYKNKSSDEFKMKGDIRKSPMYKDIESMVLGLKTLKKFSEVDAEDLQSLFKSLHLSVFATMAKEYIMEPNDKNTLYTATFTMGYRLLVGELSRIYASTKATESGIVYQPTKISRDESSRKIIKLFNDDLDKRLQRYVEEMRRLPDATAAVSEAYMLEFLEACKTECGDGAAPVADTTTGSSVKTVTEEDAETTTDTTDSSEEASTETTDSDDSVQEAFATAAAVAATGLKLMTLVFTGVTAVATIAGKIKGSIAGVNPIAAINFLLMDSYEQKIQKFNNVAALYNATKQAYDEYMKIPEAQRSEKVSSKYIKNMEKYNMSMQKLAAEIEHFNQRAESESDDIVDDIVGRLPDASIEPVDTDTTNQSSDDDFMF